MSLNVCFLKNYNPVERKVLRLDNLFKKWLNF